MIRFDAYDTGGFHGDVPAQQPTPEECREEKDGLAVMRTPVLGFRAGRGPDDIEKSYILIMYKQETFSRITECSSGEQPKCAPPRPISSRTVSTKQFHFLTLHVRGCILYVLPWRTG